MKITRAESDKNHANLTTAAGQVLREHGLEGAGVAQIADKAGLTHGAVYRHFASKDAMAAAAITADFGRIVDLLEGMADSGAGPAAYAATYLDAKHRDHFPWGCPAAPLAAEVFRAAPEVQQAFAEGLSANLAALQRLIGGEDAQAKTAAVAMLSTMVGALALARATRAADPELSDVILALTRDALTQGTSHRGKQPE
jgi:TetR/AcrR family transcriptional repressor of nem operon